ncbi:MAG: 50S ribosomal protein L4 [Hyphomicrobiales bacterium]|nr:50S ribosomal protein L4 [Hyphomicrobiales bacterium]PCH49913.1 MAG: 50S ribosomal protein L4 [Hyphomicrobiales bacterium]PCH50943.1 MAG: 50S ribosomal protein L4 [Hyphomicrobiales bacterium]
MDIKVTTLDGKASGKVSLSDEIFGLEPRADLIQRMVRYQLAKRRAGTHDVKNRSEISKTGKKMYNQKGTGSARHSTSKAPQFRGGGRAFGPTPRDHSFDLPKKVRALALRHALSAKQASDGIVVVDDLSTKASKTKALKGQLEKLGIANALFIGGAELDKNFSLAARNIPQMDVLPVQGINVYDILRREKLVLSKSAVEALEARFK